MGIRPREPDRLLPEFLALWMKLHWVHEIFSKTAQKGSGLGNFSWSAAKSLPLRYPRPGDQRRIIQAVGDADRYVELTTSRIPSLRTLLGQQPQGTIDPTDAEDEDLPKTTEAAPASTNAPNAATVDGSPELETAPCSTADSGTELETAIRLRFCLREELVAGARLLPPLLRGGDQ